MEVMVKINALIARRLRAHYAQVIPAENTLITYALIPCDASVPLPEFGRQLTRALSEFGPSMIVTCAELDQAIETGAAQAGLDDPRNPQIVSWLNELESRFRHVIYQADPEASEWSRRCLRQADRIVLVGQSKASPLRPRMNSHCWLPSPVDVLVHTACHTSGRN